MIARELGEETGELANAQHPGNDWKREYSQQILRAVRLEVSAEAPQRHSHTGKV